MDLDFLEEKGISIQDGKAYTGGEDKYISALQRYYKSYEKNKSEVRSLWESHNIGDFGIKVHALKSNSRMIGAKELADAFEELELAARDNNTSLIDEKTESALAMYDRIVEAIRPVGEAEAVTVADEISAEEARQTAQALLTALDDFDDDLSAELVHKLMGYPFRITQRGKLKEAADYIGEFMYDEAAGLINEIIPEIE